MPNYLDTLTLANYYAIYTDGREGSMIKTRVQATNQDAALVELLNRIDAIDVAGVYMESYGSKFVRTTLMKGHHVLRFTLYYTDGKVSEQVWFVEHDDVILAVEEALQYQQTKKLQFVRVHSIDGVEREYKYDVVLRQVVDYTRIADNINFLLAQSEEYTVPVTFEGKYTYDLLRLDGPQMTCLKDGEIFKQFYTDEELHQIMLTVLSLRIA